MGITILEAGYPVRESKCWSLLGMRDGEVFLDAMESVKHEVKDVKIIVAGGSGRQFKPSCPVDYVYPSDDELTRLYSSCDVFVLLSFLEGLLVQTMEAMACGEVVNPADCLQTERRSSGQLRSGKSRSRISLPLMCMRLTVHSSKCTRN